MSEATSAPLPPELPQPKLDLTVPFLWVGCKRGDHDACPGKHEKCSVNCLGIPPCICECHLKPKIAPPPPTLIPLEQQPHTLPPDEVGKVVVKPPPKVTPPVAKGTAPVVTGTAEKIQSSEFYPTPCLKCKKPIKRTGRRGRPPFVHPDGC